MAAFAKNVMLAETWDEKTVDPKGWWISEKLDGVRSLAFLCSFSARAMPCQAPSAQGALFVVNLPILD